MNLIFISSLNFSDSINGSEGIIKDNEKINARAYDTYGNTNLHIAALKGKFKYLREWVLSHFDKAPKKNGIYETNKLLRCSFFFSTQLH